MDVIINNPAAPAQFQAPAQLQGQVYAPAQPQFYGNGYGFQGHHHHGGFPLLLPLLIIGGIVLAKKMKRRRWAEMRSARGSQGVKDSQQEWNPRDFFEKKSGWWNKQDSAVEIARERYARGEISLEQLQVITKTLQE
ncbi:hypothetical protein [Deinococcus roseus]|uniref:SHOCT domain-containing protein n=1 Tax=Deinococcus roseus TaxID=392414 RepID=A0ABQ2D1R2_9DEIO|nr:hypothetical protein [Deinococcus roseus]GGJ42115.1 hypothetical protein GCM10008938_30200 [Deinococcus roseus]